MFGIMGNEGFVGVLGFVENVVLGVWIVEWMKNNFVDQFQIVFGQCFFENCWIFWYEVDRIQFDVFVVGFCVFF